MTVAATSTGVYVYGIVRADELPAVSAEGVAGMQVELIEHDGLAAVASRLPAEFKVKRRDLNRHLQVLEEAFGETTVVPCPFGTVMVSDADVETALLSDRRRELEAALKRLDGMVQLNVKAVYDEAELLRELVAGHPEVARLRESTARLGDAAYYERVRLGELVAGLVEDRRRADADRLVSALAEAAADIRYDDVGELDALKASFLVNRKDLGRFDARLEEVAPALQPVARIEVIGPLPPTAFAGEGRGV
jgi:hypothetical protein